MEKGFIYVQRTGELAIRNGDFETPLYVGVAGNSAGRNNPAYERVRNTGPLPQGEYLMRIVDHPRFAAPAIRLEWSHVQKEGLDHFNRSGFYIHGGTKSEGCILVNGATRNLIATAVGLGFDRLEVVAE